MPPRAFVDHRHAKCLSPVVVIHCLISPVVRWNENCIINHWKREFSWVNYMCQQYIHDIDTILSRSLHQWISKQTYLDVGTNKLASNPSTVWNVNSKSAFHIFLQKKNKRCTHTSTSLTLLPECGAMIFIWNTMLLIMRLAQVKCSKFR